MSEINEDNNREIERLTIENIELTEERDGAVNHVASLRTMCAEVVAQRWELQAELEASQHLYAISEEVNQGYEKDCAMGFALQRDALKEQLAKKNETIEDALYWIQLAEKRSKAGVPFEDELNEVLWILSGGPDAVIKVNKEENNENKEIKDT